MHCDYFIKSNMKLVFPIISTHMYNENKSHYNENSIFTWSLMGHKNQTETSFHRDTQCFQEKPVKIKLGVERLLHNVKE